MNPAGPDGPVVAGGSVGVGDVVSCSLQKSGTVRAFGSG